MRRRTVAVAMPLGRPGKTYGWLEPADAGLRDDSLRLGTAAPARSATGLLSLPRVGAGEGGETRAAAMMKALSAARGRR